MIRNSQKTVYGLDISLHRDANVPYTPLKNTTLNDRFKVATDIALPQGVYPTLKYLVIGVGGTPTIGGGDTFTYSEHGSLDACLFDHIPFVMRPTSGPDLSDNDRRKYRFRVIETFNNIEYYCYYAKVLDSVDISNGIFLITTTNGNSTLKDFDVNTDAYIYPTPRSGNIDPTASSDNTYATKVLKIKLSLTITELQELENSRNIIHGNNKTIVTEVGICSGYDTSINGFQEATNAQVNYHIGLDLNTVSLINDNIDFIRELEVGGQEPLLT